MSDALVIFGCGGHGKVVADAASHTWRVLGFADDDPANLGRAVAGHNVVATSGDGLKDYCAANNARVVVAVGHNRAREQIYERLVAAGVPTATVVHPSAVIAASVQLGAGTVVFANVVVNPDTYIGHNVILNTGVTIDHDNRVGDHAHISPGAHTGGAVTIGEGTHLGVGVAVRNNIQIGAWSLIGVGAAVVKDIPGDVVAYGTPARVIGPNQS